MKTRTRKFYQPSYTKTVILCILGVMVLLTGIFFISFHDVATGVILIALYMLLITCKHGFELDMKLKKFRQFNQFLIFRFGHWINLERYSNYEVQNKNRIYRTDPKYMPDSIGADNYDVILETHAGHSQDIRFTVNRQSVKEVDQSLLTLGMKRI